MNWEDERMNLVPYVTKKEIRVYVLLQVLASSLYFCSNYHMYCKVVRVFVVRLFLSPNTVVVS